MKIEVTEKEARSIYEYRYFKKKGRIKYLPLALFVIAVMAWVVVYPIDLWISIVILLVIAGTAIFINRRVVRSAVNYAEGMIANEKGKNL